MNRQGLISIRQLVLELASETQSNEEEIGTMEIGTMKDELETLIARMHGGGILYSEAVREFKKKFILSVLAANKGNQCKAAKEMGMHRNTLSRTIAELGLDVREAKDSRRRPMRSVVMNSAQKSYAAGA